VISFQPGTDEDLVMEAALEAGAEDVVVNDDGSLDVITTPEDFSAVCDRLQQAGLDTSVSEVSYNAATLAELDLETAQKLQKMVDALEDLDDVQDVFNNADISRSLNSLNRSLNSLNSNSLNNSLNRIGNQLE
jgi:transcriptional/translational regulatory protein YebC/TACO1